MSNSKKQTTRVYAVRRKGVGTVRLVRAPNWGQALRHVANDEYSVEVAGQDLLIEATSRGVPTETATKEGALPPAPQATTQTAATATASPLVPQPGQVLADPLDSSVGTTFTGSLDRPHLPPAGDEPAAVGHQQI